MSPAEGPADDPSPDAVESAGDNLVADASGAPGDVDLDLTDEPVRRWDAKRQQRGRQPGMRRGPTAVVERDGVYAVGLAVSRELSWIFREQQTDDYGIDAQIEIVDDNALVTGRMFGVQIKSGESYLRDVARSRTEAGWTYRGDSNHLAYWLGHCLPVMVVFVDEHGDIYWQIIENSTVRETRKGFTVWVPATNKLDGAAKQDLLAHARQWRDLAQRLPDLLDRLPPQTHRPLSRAIQDDPVAAPRLAELLKDGWSAPPLTLHTLLDAPPSWVSDSPAAESLWMAVGAFALAHDCNELASAIFEVAAGVAGDRRARALALAGFSLLNVDRTQAEPFLLQALEAGDELLASAGLALVPLPPDDARAVDIPAAILNATPEAVDAEPTVLNFLAEMAWRNGDAEGAVKYRERARSDDRPGGDMDLALATTLIKAARTSAGTGSAYMRRAVNLIQGVIESRRRWHGPSGEAVEALAELHFTSASFTEVLNTTLPAARGGSLYDREMNPSIARMGAMAALAEGRDEDAAVFENFLADTFEGREIRELRRDGEDLRSREDKISAWTALLADASDDSTRARLVERLARLGHLSPVIEDLRARSILGDGPYELIVATFDANDPHKDREVGRLGLRDLAWRSSPSAALMLVRHLDDAGKLDAALAACIEFSARWPEETLLGVELVSLHWRAGDRNGAVGATKRYLLDDRLPIGTRLAMCRIGTSKLYAEFQHAQAVDMARLGLSLGEDADLAWNLVVCLHAQGRIAEALAELRRHRPRPTKSQEVRLWTELHLGVQFTPDDAAVLLELARAESDPGVREVLYSLLDREVVRGECGQSAELRSAARELLTLSDPTYDPARGPIDAAPKNEPSEVTASRLRGLLAEQALTPELVARWMNAYSRGTKPLHEIASRMGQAYGFALIQRPNLCLAASDLTAGLRAVGQRAARRALAERSTVVDLSALLTLSLLNPAHRALLRGRLVELKLPAALARDVAQAREQVRDAVTRPALLSMRTDGRPEWVRHSFADRTGLLSRIAALEELTSLTRTVVTVGLNVTDRIVALAAAQASTVWCDDNALRQHLRGRRISTFSTIELLDAIEVMQAEDVARASHAGAPGEDAEARQPDDIGAIQTALARNHFADVPLSGVQLVQLIDESPRAVQLALSRDGWWDDRRRTYRRATDRHDLIYEWSPEWRKDWPVVARASAEQDSDIFLLMFGSALTGLSEASDARTLSKNQLDLFVATMSACWRAGLKPPASLFEGFDPDPDQPLGPEVVNAALIAELARLGAEDATAAAWNLLHP